MVIFLFMIVGTIFMKWGLINMNIDMREEINYFKNQRIYDSYHATIRSNFKECVLGNSKILICEVIYNDKIIGEYVQRGFESRSNFIKRIQESNYHNFDWDNQTGWRVIN